MYLGWFINKTITCQHRLHELGRILHVFIHTAIGLLVHHPDLIMNTRATTIVVNGGNYGFHSGTGALFGSIGPHDDIASTSCTYISSSIDSVTVSLCWWGVGVLLSLLGWCIWYLYGGTHVSMFQNLVSQWVRFFLQFWYPYGRHTPTHFQGVGVTITDKQSVEFKSYTE